MTGDDQARRRAVLQAAKELGHDGPQASVEELVDFIAGQSSPEAAERVSDQATFEYASREMLLDLAALRRGEEAGELEDQEVEDDWRALLERIEVDPASNGVQTVFETQQNTQGPEPPLRRGGSWRVPLKRRWRQAVSDVLAASFLLTSLGLGYHLMSSGDQARGFSEVITLHDGTGITRSDKPVAEDWQMVQVAGSSFALSFRSEEPKGWTDFQTIVIDFFAASGTHVKQISMKTGPDPRDSPKVLVDKDWLGAGRYRIVLQGLGPNQDREVKIGEYQIYLHYGGDPTD